MNGHRWEIKYERDEDGLYEVYIGAGWCIVAILLIAVILVAVSTS